MWNLLDCEIDDAHSKMSWENHIGKTQGNVDNTVKTEFAPHIDMHFCLSIVLLTYMDEHTGQGVSAKIAACLGRDYSVSKIKRLQEFFAEGGEW